MRAFTTHSSRGFVVVQRAALRGLMHAALIASSACVCQEEGCESFESLSVTIPLTESELEGKRLEVCRNDECFVGVLAVTDIDWADASHPEHEVAIEPADPAASGNHQAICQLSRTADGFSLVFEWYPANDGRVERGDVLRVSVDDAEGGELFARDAKVTDVDENYPNGEECDEAPCRSASLKG